MTAARSIWRGVGLDRALGRRGMLAQPDQGVGDPRVVLGGQLRQEVVADSGLGCA